MQRYNVPTRIFICLVVAASIAITMVRLQPREVTGPELAALACLALGAAIASAFPIRSASGGAVYHLTGIFFVAGSIILRPAFCTLLPVLALTPETWRRRDRPGALARWLFNTAQTVLAMHVTSAWFDWLAGGHIGDARGLVALLGASVLFTLAQAVLVGAIISLQSRTPFLRSDTFAVPALLSDGLIAICGTLIAGLWLSMPTLLLLALPLLVIAHRLTRDAHLAHFAQVDAKTGLHNSRHFEAALEEELAHSHRMRRPLAVLFADLDHFKRINDEYGHAAGDRVLREIASILTEVLRKGDTIARFGGEEFVALLPGADPEEATYLAERLRATVEAAEFDLGGGTRVRCTISVGVAFAPQNGTEVAELLRQADMAMYRAKQTRNAVAHPEPASRLRPPISRARRADASSTDPEATPSWAARPTLWTVVCLAAMVTGASLVATWSTGSWPLLLPFLALALAAELLTVRIQDTGREETISFSFTIAVTMAAVPLEHVPTPLVSLAAALLQVALFGRHRGVERGVFNLANPTLAAAAADAAYTLLRPADGAMSAWYLLAAAAAVIAFQVVNVGLVVLMISLHSRRSLIAVARQSAWFAPTNALLGFTGVFVGEAHTQLGPLGVAMFALPVLVMRFTLAFTAERSRRSIEVLQAMNRQLGSEIGQREHAEEQLRRVAFQDPLTKLPNRTALLEWLESALEQARTGGGRVAVLCLSLDRFRIVNDGLGHAAGDSVLLCVRDRLQAHTDSRVRLAHLGGDEFALTIDDVRAGEAMTIAQALLRDVEQPVVVAGHQVFVTASVGVALNTGDDDERPATLLRNAAVAMQRAKTRGRGRCEVFDTAWTAGGRERLELEADLRTALAEGGLLVYYQPLVNLATGRIEELEALVRWLHPQRGFLSPADFLPLAEDTGLIKQVGAWVLDEGCKQLSAWQRIPGYEHLSLAVNLSARQLDSSSELLADVRGTLAATGLDPRSLTLELTETVAMQDAETTATTLRLFRKLGVRLAIDDFGTGYSSLAYLRQFPVDTLKVDRSFVAGIGRDDQETAIVRSVVALAHSLGLGVTAEGVENALQRDQVRALGVHRGQGYYFARPLPADEIGRMLETTAAWPQAAAA
jgi:diguanylate cyclase (GGDEF)-like protein